MDGRVVRARVKRGGRLRTGAAVASVLLLGSLAGLTGCGTTGPSDADRASWQSWAAAIVDSDPDATVSGGFDAIVVPIAVRDLVSLTVTATSADGEGVWTAQLQR